MSNIDMAKYLISSIAGQENYLTVNRTFVDYMESLEGGIFLQQLIFWSDKSSRADGFFYKTYSDWQKEVCLSEYSVRKQTKKLADKGFLKTMLKKANGSPTLHYKFHLEPFLKDLEWFLKNLRMETENFQNENLNISVSSITEEYDRRIQQKTTTEKSISSSLIDNSFLELKDFYELKIAKTNFTTDKKLADLLDDYHDSKLIIEAMQVALAKDKNPLSYAKGILKNWNEEHDITTYAQLIARKENSNETNSRQSGNDSEQRRIAAENERRRKLLQGESD